MLNGELILCVPIIEICALIVKPDVLTLGYATSAKRAPSHLFGLVGVEHTNGGVDGPLASLPFIDCVALRLDRLGETADRASATAQARQRAEAE